MKSEKTMRQRPELNKGLDAATFRSFYYLKQELADFCTENGLPASGSKAELTDRIAYFLDTGTVLKFSAAKKSGCSCRDADRGHGHRAEYRLLRKAPCFFP